MFLDNSVNIKTMSITHAKLFNIKTFTLDLIIYFILKQTDFRSLHKGF